MISEVLKGYYDAFQNAKWEELENYLTDDFTYYTDTCVIQDKKSFVSFLAGTDWKVNTYKISDLTLINSSDNDLVVALYKVAFQGISGGVDQTLYATETTIFKKQKGSYKIIHSHTSNK